MMRNLIISLFASGLALQAAFAQPPNWGPYRGVNTNARLTEADIRDLAGWGANLVRANFAFRPLMSKKPPYAFDEEAFAYLDQLLDWCAKYKIGVVIDPHTSPGLAMNTTTQPNDEFWKDFSWHDHLIRLWGEIARRYKGRGAVIEGYDLLNEPNLPNQEAKDTPADWNLLVRKLVKTIRANDPRHTIIIEPPMVRIPGMDRIQAIAHSMEYLAAPPDPNIVYSPHMYLPGEYTHQGVLANLRDGVAYPGVMGGVMWNRAALEKALDPVVRLQQRYHAPIFIGEFSAVRWRPDANTWLDDAIRIFEEHGWNWSYHAFRAADPWDAERSNDTRTDVARRASTPRIELLKGYYQRNATASASAKDAVLQPRAANLIWVRDAPSVFRFTLPGEHAVEGIMQG